MSLPDSTLCDAVAEMAAGLIDADLGGSVYKKRVPMPGRGKRGGARIIPGSDLGGRWVFLFGFEKNDRATIDARELASCSGAVREDNPTDTRTYLLSL